MARSKSGRISTRNGRYTTASNSAETAKTLPYFARQKQGAARTSPPTYPPGHPTEWSGAILFEPAPSWRGGNSTPLLHNQPAALLVSEIERPQSCGLGCLWA
jgi:hypothetical protein